MAGRGIKTTDKPAKVTRAEMNRRVQAVYKLIVGGTPRASILQHAAEKWDVKERQCDEYIARASALFEQQSAVDYALEFGKSKARTEYLFHQATLKGDLPLMLKIQQEINHMHGLYAPTKTELSGADGGAIQTEIILRQIPERKDD
jgi:hypothetical protein